MLRNVSRALTETIPILQLNISALSLQCFWQRWLILTWYEHVKNEIQEATKEVADSSVLKEKLVKITLNEDIAPEYKSRWL